MFTYFQYDFYSHTSYIERRCMRILQYIDMCNGNDILGKLNKHKTF